MGKRYDAALARFLRNCGDPQDPAERARLEAAFGGTIIGATCRYKDAEDALIESLKSTRLGRFMFWLSDLINGTGKDRT